MLKATISVWLALFLGMYVGVQAMQAVQAKPKPINLCDSAIYCKELQWHVYDGVKRPVTAYFPCR